MIKFTDTKEIKLHKKTLKSYLLEAVELEKFGAKVIFKKNPEPIPEELLDVFSHDTVFKDAFYALTPGKQRGYILYFSQSKQTSSRKNRIEKYRQQILNGIGMHDKYSS